MRKQKLFSIALMTGSLVLMALPNGIPMTFFAGPTESKTVFYSYFSRIPYGYGNIFPMITAVFSIFILLLFLASFKKNRKWAIELCLLVAVAASIASWCLFRTFHFIGLIVCLLHTAVFISQLIANHRKIGKIEVE